MSTHEPVPHKPTPQIDDLSRPFWDAANKRRLVLQRCQNCKRYHHPPIAVCLDCLSVDLAFEPVSGRGRISTYTITHDARHSAFQALQPYTLAIVELEEQARIFMFSNIPGTTPDKIRIGLPVEVAFEEIIPGRLIPQFRAVE